MPMSVAAKLKLGFLSLLLALPTSYSSLVTAGEEEQRAPPEARSSGTLSQQVMRAITDIQEMMSPEDESQEPDFEGAKIALDELRERRWDRMNDFEKSTTLNFYTNYYLSTENYRGALETFEEILTIEELREDTRLRTLRSLGQLYAAEEEWSESIRNYEMWRELSLEEDPIVFRGLSYAHYQLEEYVPARDYWLDFMAIAAETGEELGRDEYAYLNGIYFTLEDFESALDVTRTMIMLFDNPQDWMNLSAVYASLDNESRRVESLNLAYLKGYLDDENRYLNLGQSLAGREIPLTGAKILNAGRSANIVEDNQDNLQIVLQMYMIANDFPRALPLAEQVAELDDTGNGYDQLGYIHYSLKNYEESAEAFEAALDKGGLDDRADTFLFLARALVELDDYDGAESAARQASDAGDESDRESATQYLRYIDGVRNRFNVLRQRREDAGEFYQAYPALNVGYFEGN
jgi:tetratricopeptide (TPR) repeat protein